MTPKKQKPKLRKPDLTFEADSYIEFVDRPRGAPAGNSPGVVTSYDPAVAALGDRLKRGAGPKRLSANGNSIRGTKMDADAREVQMHCLSDILDECLQAARTIKNKRAAELVKLLRDARKQIELIPR